MLEHAWRHPPRTRHALLEVSLGDGLPRLFVLHLRAWFSKWSEQRRARELRGLLDGIREQLVREEHAFAFHLLAGDFNALAPGERFDTSPDAGVDPRHGLAQRPRHRAQHDRDDAGRRLRRRVAHDACRIADVEPGYTFPVWEPHVRLDYVFTPSAYAVAHHRLRGAARRRTRRGRRRTTSRCSSRSPSSEARSVRRHSGA